MRKLLQFILMFVVVFTGTSAGNAHADELMESFSVRITIETDEEAYQWKYDSPNYYEFQHDDRVLRGEEAKSQVENMSALVDLTENSTSEVLASRVKETFPKMKAMDIRWRNAESELYTWRWIKNDTAVEQ